MENITYGYVRVSSKDQNIERQLIALKNAGISEKHIYIDRQSGKNFNRPAYKSMLRKLKSGDIIVTKSIDRLGRNYEEIMEQWRIITKVKGADIVIQDMPLLDTSKTRDLLGTFISDLVLQLLSFFSNADRVPENFVEVYFGVSQILLRAFLRQQFPLPVADGLFHAHFVPQKKVVVIRDH